MTAKGAPIPIAEMGTRMPEQGRIRIGVKTDTRQGFRALDTFRLTSADESAIRAAAEVYGGTAVSWTDGPRAGEWEVITERRMLPILLPPDPLRGTPIYELWRQSGLIRRCDGVTCSLPVGTPDGQEWEEAPCVCAVRRHTDCKPKTRLVVILRDVPFGGGWRFETGSEISAREMPGMVETIFQLQERGLPLGLLTLANESTKVHYIDKNGEDKIRTSHFKVVRLSTAVSIADMAAGLNDVSSLGRGSTQALEVGPAPVATDADVPAPDHQGDLDDDIVDAELVEDDLGSSTAVVGGNRNLETALVIAIKTMVAQHLGRTGIEHRDDDVRHDLVEQLTTQTRGPAGAVRSSVQLTDVEKRRLLTVVDAIVDEDPHFALSFTGEGKARIGRRSDSETS